MSKKDKKIFSFIIPSYNSASTIGRTLDALLKQKRLDLVKEIIVVDSSTDSETRQELKRYRHPLIKTILLSRKTPPGEGRNIGVQASSGKMLCFFDSDIIAIPEWIEMIADAIERGERAGCTGTDVAPGQEWNMIALAQHYFQSSEFLDGGADRQVKLAPGSNLFCERELFLKVGGFPAIRASEDTLFSLKVSELTPLWMIPRAVCGHVYRTEWIPTVKNQIMQGKYILFYRRQHFGSWYYCYLCSFFMMPAFGVIKLIRTLWRISAAGPRHLLKVFYCLPVFLTLWFLWMWGMILASFQKEPACVQTEGLEVSSLEKANIDDKKDDVMEKSNGDEDLCMKSGEVK